MLKEFKEFAFRGSVLDLAVGVLIGAAFGKIVSSAVNDLLTPILSLFLGRIDFSNLFISLSGSYSTLKEAQEAGAATINYGHFLQAFLDFVIVAFAIFLLVKQVNRFRAAPAPPASGKECPFCISAIPLKASRCPNCTSQLQAT